MSRRLTYANVVSSLALFIALGGASYAVTTLPRGSVGPRQIRKGAVTPAKLAAPVTTLSNDATGSFFGIYCPPTPEGAATLCATSAPVSSVAPVTIHAPRPGRVVLLTSTELSAAESTGTAEIDFGTTVTTVFIPES